ncbi:L,D-transpeptidase OS=Streptomyces fumanus OX=67302 GN=GCM10018772_68500 PE=4 SV=1 [Streptomyces fumanus]
MTVYRNGEEIKEIPVTTGKPGFETRNGVKVVLGKEAFVRMAQHHRRHRRGLLQAYDLPVHWATPGDLERRDVHAASSVGSQGSANVSHGCTGMSTENAEWFFDTVREGDLVEVVNSFGDTMETFGNGFGDWNLDWDKWRTGSAVLGGGVDAPRAEDASRLRPTAA